MRKFEDQNGRKKKLRTKTEFTLQIENQNNVLTYDIFFIQLPLETLVVCSMRKLRLTFFVLLIFLQVDELQNTIEEEQKNMIEEMRMATEELKNGMEDASGGSEAMAVDQPMTGLHVLVLLL